jgi:acyl-CoA dehydrogenase
LVPEVVRLYLPGQVPKGLAQALEECVLHAPSFTLRGGTREILRGMIARGLGLR